MPGHMNQHTENPNTNSLDLPIRQLQVRVPLPPEEEPPKDRMDRSLQEVRTTAN